MRALYAFLQERPKLSLGLALLWTFVIYWGCTLPGKDLPKINVFDQFDKLVHATFFFFFFILWMAYRSNTLWVFVSAIAFGFGLEFYQHYLVIGRSFDVWDGIADTFGAVLGWLALQKIKVI